MSASRYQQAGWNTTDSYNYGTSRDAPPGRWSSRPDPARRQTPSCTCDIPNLQLQLDFKYTRPQYLRSNGRRPLGQLHFAPAGRSPWKIPQSLCFLYFTKLRVEANELIRHTTEQHAYAVTLPMHTTSADKFTYNSMLMQSHCQCTLPVRTAMVRWVTEDPFPFLEAQLASLPAFVKDLGIWKQSALTCQVVTLTHEIALTVLASHVRERSKNYLWQGNAQITAGEFPNNPRTSPFKLQMSW